MGFKSDKFRKMMFAVDADKKKGIMPLSESKTPMNNSFTLPKAKIPTIPSLPKTASFNRIKKFFKN